MDSAFWTIFSVLILVVLVGVAAMFLYLSRGKNHKTDYFSLFIIGLVWFIAGIPLANSALWVIGLVFIVVGVANSRKWKSYKRLKWKELSRSQKLFKIWTLIVLVILVAVLCAYILFNGLI